MRLTLRIVNNELIKRGIDAMLRRGESEYFYFWGGETGEWWDRTVQAPTLNSLGLDQWIAAYQDLKRKNAQILAMGKAGAKAKRVGPPRTKRAGK